MTPSCSSAPLRTPPLRLRTASAPPLHRLRTPSAGDTLGTREILVMDSDKFPFYRAELYHQFHNDFQVRGGGWVSGRPRPGLGRGQLASRLGQLPSRVGRGDTPTPLLPGFLPTPIGGLLPIYLNMRMHNTVCVPSCRARRMARPTIGFSACLPRRAASAPPAARRRRFEQRGLRHASSARPGRRDRARDLFVVRDAHSRFNLLALPLDV